MLEIFDSANDGACGDVGGENCVPASEVGLAGSDMKPLARGSVCVPLSIRGQAGSGIKPLLVRRSVCVARAEVEMVVTEGSVGRAGLYTTTLCLVR